MFITTILLTVLVIIIGYVFKLAQKHFSYWQELGIACDEPSYSMGNLKGVMEKRTFKDLFQQFYDKYRDSGPFVGFYWFLAKAVVIVDPALLKCVLIKDFSKFADRHMFVNEEDDPLSGQLFNLDGAKWRNMRNKLSPTFTSGKMKNMFPIVTEIGEELVKVFSAELSSGAEIEVKDLMARYTTDVIGNCAFGIDCSSLKDPTAKFRMMGRRAIVEQRYGTLGMTFRFSFPELAKKLHMKETVQDIEDFFMGITRETVEYREKNNIRRNDFLDMLIDLKNNKLMKTEDGEQLTNLSLEEIAAQAFVFLVAGFETSSTTMGYALYELAQHQNIQQRAREEINEVLQKHNNEFSYECMKEMQYLDQIIAETLRLYTIVPVINRYCTEDFVFEDNPKYSINKGITVLIPAAAIHRDERYYPNPNVFNPDHFTADKVAQRDSVLYLPFGDGPRNCIGMRFGKMQTLVGLALLLKNFKFSVCNQTQIPLKYNNKSFLLSSEKGIYLRVEKL